MFARGQSGVIQSHCPTQASCSTFSPRSAARVNMPPDSKDLSSLKDKSLSFHRLHATDLDRMKGIYLSAEELRGFDKYKVQLDQLIVSVARSITDRSSEYYSWFFFTFFEICYILRPSLFSFSTNQKIHRPCQTT